VKPTDHEGPSKSSRPWPGRTSKPSTRRTTGWWCLLPLLFRRLKPAAILRQPLCGGLEPFVIARRAIRWVAAGETCGPRRPFKVIPALTGPHIKAVNPSDDGLMMSLTFAVPQVETCGYPPSTALRWVGAVCDCL